MNRAAVESRPAHRSAAAVLARGWVLTWTVAACVVGAALAVFGPDLARVYGYPSLGVVLNVGMPVARMLAVGAAVGAVAAMLLATIYAPGAPRGALSPRGYRSLRTARLAALVYVIAAAAVAVLTFAETAGVGLGGLLGRPAVLMVGLWSVEPAFGWLVSAGALLVVALFAGAVLTWRGAVGLLVCTLLGLAVPPLTAVANSERSHDWYGDSLTLHVLAAVIWLASTVAVAAQARRGPVTEMTMRRHRIVAGASAVVVFASGAVPSALAAPPAQLLSSGFGQLVVLSAVALCAATALARRRPPGSGPARVLQFLALEAGLLAFAAAAGTAMSRLLPPDQGMSTDPLVFLLGYGLPPQLGLVELALWWRIDLIFAPLAVLGAAGYLIGVRRLRRGGGTWPWPRTVAWCAGCLTVLVATSSGIGSYATAVFSVHMAGHALLATVAPALLVLGHPLSLVRACARPATAERVSALADAGPMRTMRNPAVAWLIAAVALFGMYATGLFDAIVLEHWSHPLMTALALGSGLILFRSVIGHSPTGAQRPALVRLGGLFAIAMLHAGFSVWLLGLSTPLAEPFYAALNLTYVPGLVVDQRFGAILAWIVSDVAMVAVAVAVIRSWWQETDAEPAASPQRLHERT
ncbi:cytochrome c oxidase assembly protein [Pseudonocardia sp. KRD291]|uniref:cytochrome c oxidase assembly protein n=1 Tax=Pseudonocardia sp. KRD291 TaxID=2792007 RepID=UPI001C4A5885|nr:cytochrome c oxidase assembly protein [Pseudonocardia sp. KRD291]MBW0102147.1 cytochrome c oxidase assembly protein [Pseudonocardia sp. KRD291]